ncbi:premnaspirodiene oxygenase-like [Pistacia vera]|uniref:premnaspirodiene oxygenase-like n=1 Tax=Pistacia vera TaxID=55513 RepID=UPI001262F98F|nr:premnaspirodiene oxygenase-like [Pistacia vera]
MTFGITTRAAFGGKMKDQKAFVCAIEEGIDLAGGFTVADVFPSFEFIDSISGVKSKIKEIHDRVDRLFDAIIDEHKSRRATRKTNEREEDDDHKDFLDDDHKGFLDDDHKDFLDVLWNLQNNGDHDFTFSNDNIKAVIVVRRFHCWGDTSSTTVEWAMSELLKNPRAMEKAQAEVRNVFRMKGTVDEEGLHELNYLKAAIKESMRLHPAAPLLLPRECRKSCEIFGYEIPVKTKVW